jgi:hypothetical protein
MKGYFIRRLLNLSIKNQGIFLCNTSLSCIWLKKLAYAESCLTPGHDVLHSYQS